MASTDTHTGISSKEERPASAEHVRMHAGGRSEATPTSPDQRIEPFYTTDEAARILGVKKFAIERSVRKGEIPHYTFFNSRKLVRVSEIEAFILSSRQGGN